MVKTVDSVSEWAINQNGDLGMLVYLTYYRNHLIKEGRQDDVAKLDTYVKNQPVEKIYNRYRDSLDLMDALEGRCGSCQ